MQSLILTVFFLFGGMAYAGTLAECKEAAKSKPNECDQTAKENIAKSNSKASEVANACSSFKTNKCSIDNKSANDFTKALLQNAIAICETKKSECEQKCSNPPPNDRQAQQEMPKLKEQCRSKIEKTKADLAKGAGANDGASGDSQNTADSAKGNGQNPMMPPMPPPKEDDKKEDEKKAETTPASIPTEAKKEDPKPADGKTGFDEKSPSASPQSLNACSPLFAQKCSSGDTSACLAKLSAADRQKITADCSNTSALADPNVAKALTSNTGGMSAQSLPGNGTSGGGAMGGGGDSAAMLVQPKTGDDESQLGKREGGSMGVDSAGGGGGYSGDSGNIFGEDPATPVLPAGLSARGLASAFGQSTVDPGHSVVDRYGPSVFSIVESTLQSRCARNLHYHCRPQAR